MSLPPGNKAASLLAADDPTPFEVVNAQSKSPVLLVCEHAGTAIPRSLNGLGISDRELNHHIGHDIGAEELARLLAREIGATLVLQPYSRLVVDCNRPFESSDCVPEESHGIEIPGNQRLSQEDRRQRYDAIHQRFHAEVERRLNARAVRGAEPALITVHSFTPRLSDAHEERVWHIGLLFNRDARLAEAMMAELRGVAGEMIVEFNEPYGVDDEGDYTVPVHGEVRGIPHVLIEVRNDEISTPDDRRHVAQLLGNAIRRILPSNSQAVFRE